MLELAVITILKIYDVLFARNPNQIHKIIEWVGFTLGGQNRDMQALLDGSVLLDPNNWVAGRLGNKEHVSALWCAWFLILFSKIEF